MPKVPKKVVARRIARWKAHFRQKRVSLYGTQMKMAAATGIPQRTISAWEAPGTRVPSIDQLAALDLAIPRMAFTTGWIMEGSEP